MEGLIGDGPVVVAARGWVANASKEKETASQME